MALIRRRESGETNLRRAWDPFEVMQELMRWDPFRELSRGTSADLSFIPAFEVKEKKDKYVIRADLPGITEEDLDLSVVGRQLTVSGKREEEKRDEDDRVYTYERSYGSFSRSFTLPDGADPDNIDAELKDGVLTITVGKKPGVQPRRIPLLGRRPENKA